MSIVKGKGVKGIVFFLGTNNTGKIEEYRALLYPVKFVTPMELSIDFYVKETGKSYRENAKQKAVEGFRLTGMPAIADDSGLEIETLGGYPGIYSARQFSLEKILYRLKGKKGEQRKARFVAVIALAYKGGVYFFTGVLEGLIAEEARGESGFGYDPIFYLPQYNKTVAELSFEQKNQISHRGKAAVKLRDFILRRGLVD